MAQGTKRGKHPLFASFCTLSHWSPLDHIFDYARVRVEPTLALGLNLTVPALYRTRQ
jgi:hypothetical protein